MCVPRAVLPIICLRTCLKYVFPWVRYNLRTASVTLCALIAGPPTLLWVVLTALAQSAWGPVRWAFARPAALSVALSLTGLAVAALDAVSNAFIATSGSAIQGAAPCTTLHFSHLSVCAFLVLCRRREAGGWAKHLWPGQVQLP